MTDESSFLHGLFLCAHVRLRVVEALTHYGNDRVSSSHANVFNFCTIKKRLSGSRLEAEMADWSPIAKLYDPLKAGSIDGTDVEPHDRAVWRAMGARYKPNKGVFGDPLLTLFVSRLNPMTTEDKLYQVFSKYGDILQLRLVRDIVTGFSKRYAFVEYKEERSVVRARRDANKLVVCSVLFYLSTI